MKKTRKNKTDDCPKFRTVAEYESLPADKREKVDNYYSRKISLNETRALTTTERARFERTRPSLGRPRIGQGAKVVAVTLEKGFLREVDAYAKQHEMKRAEVITRGLRLFMRQTA